MEKILVLDFGGQYNQLIARRVREHHVYAEIKPYNKITVGEIKEIGYKGIIFTGGPNSVYDEKSPHYDPVILNIGIPILGICYGDQLMAYMAGGVITSAENSSEYGKTTVYVKNSVLFKGVPEKSTVWMSHTDYVKEVPAGFEIIGYTDKCPCAAMCDEKRKLYGVQFHPEVTHSEFGKQMLYNFLFDVCGCAGDWTMDNFVESSVSKYKKELSGKRVLLALSGGVDSSVAAVLLHKAIGDDLTCVFVDHGLLRKDEGDFVEATFKGHFGLNLIRVGAEERFLSKLAGVTEPEQKRKIIGEEFIRVFEDEAKKLGKINVLVQGTIYPDVIESGAGDAAVIKSHHNVGGLPDCVDFKEIIRTEGDCFARYMVRMEEIMESMNIIEQLIDNIPEGPFQEKTKAIIKVPEGSYYAAVEGSRGEFGVFLESRGDKYPYRLKFRSTGLPLVSIMETVCRGAKIADLIAIGGTVDYVVPDIDR